MYVCQKADAVVTLVNKTPDGKRNSAGQFSWSRLVW